MEDYPLPAPFVGMLRASKLTGKPIVKTELLSTKLHVTISWDLAFSAPRKTKNRQSMKTAKPAPTTQQPAKSSVQQPPATTPAPATPAPAPTVIRRPSPKRCHLKWQLDWWGINRRTCLPLRFVNLPTQPHQLRRRRNKALNQRLRRRQRLNDLLHRQIPLPKKMTPPIYSYASLQLPSLSLMRAMLDL